MNQRKAARLWRELFGFQEGDTVRFIVEGQIQAYDGTKIGMIRKGQRATIVELTEWGAYISLKTPRHPTNYKLMNLEAIEFVSSGKVKVQRR